MSLYIVDIHGELEGDYEIIKNYEEPFINKPCVSEKACEHDKNVVIDKIRAEILEEMLSHSGTGEEVIQAYADGLKKGLDFIDKYKGESESQESDTEKLKEWSHKPCINYEDGCEEWAGCPCVYYKCRK